MNVTFLIGNGFDLSLGLHTKYSDFFDYYLGIPSTDKDILNFKDDIRHDIDTWSDLEKALGDYTAKFKEDTVDVFMKCYYDLCDNLREYFLQLNIDKAALQNVDKKQTLFSLYNFEKILEGEKESQAIAELKNNRGKLLACNFINFNYTTMLDNLIVELNESKEPEVLLNLSEIVHVHGKITDLLVGVDSEKGISNKALKTNPMLCKNLIKHNMNMRLANTREDIAKTMLNNSNVFIIFGMSIGVSDSRWWNYIASILYEKFSTYLIICWYEKGVEKFSPYKKLNIKDNLIDAFLSLIDLSQDRKNIIKNRIYVSFNSKLFVTNNETMIDLKKAV